MKIIIIILFLVFSLIPVYSQSADEVLLFININEKDEKKAEYTFLKEIDKEINIIVSGLFVFYKSFISSQDAGSCSFKPSCSLYAIQSIKYQGFIKGMMNFFDRFTRCNGLSPEAYPIHPETHLLDDPLRDFYYVPISHK